MIADRDYDLFRKKRTLLNTLSQIPYVIGAKIENAYYTRHECYSRGKRGNFQSLIFMRPL